MTAPIAPTPSTEGGADPKAAAREIAAAAISHARETGVIGTPPTEPATPAVTPPPTDVTPTPEPALTPAPAPPVDPSVTPPADPAAVVTPTDVVELATEAGVPLEEVVETLAGYGISVETDGVPADLRDHYGRLLEGVSHAVAPVFELDGKTKAQLHQLDVFKTRLDEKPESILLSLMVHKPEAFAKVMEIAEKAKEDEDYRATVEREVALEARESSLLSREASHTQQQLVEKGRRAEVAVEAAVKRYGVDPAVADRMVAGMVDAQGADFKLSSIDGIIGQLRPKVAAPKPPPMVTPEMAKAVALAPTAPAAVDSPPAPPGTSSGLNSETTQTHRGGFMRGLIKAAGIRVDSGR